MSDLKTKTENLRHQLAPFNRILVAYSGGVDSGVLLWLTQKWFGSRVEGILADSPSLKRSEKEKALEFAEKHNLSVRVISTDELNNPSYQSNPVNRCYFCKHTLFEQMNQIAISEQFDALCYGENFDDATQERPGRFAADSFQVLAPLKTAQLSKKEIREIARQSNLEISDKVAQPCLASRIPHGQSVTAEKLKQIEKAEEHLNRAGFKIIRVRHHGKKALVQVGPDETDQLLNHEKRTQVESDLLQCGFEEIEIDPQGYQGASLL